MTVRKAAPSRGRSTVHRQGEARLPAALAVVSAIALYALLPNSLVVGPRMVVPGLEAALLIVLVAANPRRMSRENRALRAVSITLIVVIGLANAVALVLLLHGLVTGEKHQGAALLLAAFQVWMTNLIVFALAYWELDRGGPVRRTTAPRDQLGAADFRFSQDENHDAVSEVAVTASRTSGWVPGFVDYFYVSCTNSTAFSPTDTMPLSPRAKLLMAVESVSSLMITLIIIARAVSQLQ